MGDLLILLWVIAVIASMIGGIVRYNQRQYERRLLEENPEAWKARKAVEMEREDRKRAAIAKGAQFGVGTLLRLLRK